MADWEGFTEADLRKLQNGSGKANLAQRPKIVKPVGGKRAPGQASNKARQAAANKRNAAGRKATNSTGDVPQAALLSNPPSKEVIRSKSVEQDEKHEEKLVTDAKSSISDEKEETFVVDDAAIQKKEKIKLEDVHVRQKQMEEKNRRKRAMLTKEIADRKKKAIAESSKLVKVQFELNKLDQLLNFDVSVLRDKIDDACLEFTHAQRRFKKAEDEYIAAKMELHTKTIMKEDLTEHLFNLIQVNEERKAKKLEELMQKLNVEEEELEAHEEIRKQKEEEKRSQERSTPPGGSEITPSTGSADDHPIKCEDKKDTSSTAGNVMGDTKQTVAQDSGGDSLHGANTSKQVET